MQLDNLNREHMCSGHVGCPGCGAALAMRFLLKALGEKTIMIIPACCWSIIAGPYPQSTLKIPVLHTAFETGGAVASGAGLLMVGLADWSILGQAANQENYTTAMLIVGIAITGFAHGLINAPVVTHIAQSNLAEKIGASTATATYRLMERIGHVAGPVLIGQFFILSGQDASVLAWIGAAIMIFGLVFFVNSAQPRAPDLAPGYSQ